jgi:hypothetical protein
VFPVYIGARLARRKTFPRTEVSKICWAAETPPTG